MPALSRIVLGERLLSMFSVSVLICIATGDIPC